MEELIQKMKIEHCDVCKGKGTVGFIFKKKCWLCGGTGHKITSVDLIHELIYQHTSPLIRTINKNTKSIYKNSRKEKPYGDRDVSNFVGE